MTVESVALADFSGGESRRLAASDFSERQWAKLQGLIVEDTTRVRSQWSCTRHGDSHSVGAAGVGFDEFGLVTGYVVARKPDGTFWWLRYISLGGIDGTDTPETSRDETWTQLTEITADPELHILCNLPVDHDGLTRDGLLINGRDRAGSAYAVTRSGANGTPPSVKEWTAKWPGVEVTENVMPPANVGGMWFDYLVLGDILWVEDPDQPLSDTNSRRYADALWFSEPTAVDTFDPLGVQQLTMYESVTGNVDAAVKAIQQADFGLFVLSHDGASIYLSPPSDPEFVPFRKGVGASFRSGLTTWEHVGVVVWSDTQGRLFQTDGQDVMLLNRDWGLDPGGLHGRIDAVVGFKQHLVVATRDGELLVLTEMDMDEGAWSTLFTPHGAGIVHMEVGGSGLYVLSAHDGSMWRYSLAPGARGWIDRPTDLVRPQVATRTIDVGGHQATFWHRLGIRATGGGTVEAVTVKPGPALDPGQPSMDTVLGRALGSRDEVMLPMHGPSVECSVQVVFEGDVQVEQLELWYHQGRGSR